jgi:DNA-binding transcriptional regulator of glucitol operon
VLTAGATVADVDRRFLKPGWLGGHALVLVAFLVCLRLGWWQWDRTHDADGSMQNLAYAVLWPAFGAGFIYMWVRFLQLEKIKDAADDHDMDAGLTEILADGPGRRAATDVSATDVSAIPETPSSELVRSVETPDATADVDPTDGAVEEDSAEAGRTGEARIDQPATGELFVGTVHQVDDDEDPEMAAYNRALAALAEEDRRRAR